MAYNSLILKWYLPQWRNPIIIGPYQILVSYQSTQNTWILKKACDPKYLQNGTWPIILGCPRGARKWWASGPRGTERPDIYSTLQSSYCCTSPVSITFFWNPSELTKLVQPRLSFGCHSVYLKCILGFSLFYTHNHFFWGVSGVLLRCLLGVSLGCLWSN